MVMRTKTHYGAIMCMIHTAGVMVGVKTQCVFMAAYCHGCVHFYPLFNTHYGAIMGVTSWVCGGHLACML